MTALMTTKKEQVKERIGRAAMYCFAKYGLDRTTLEDIAHEVGLNKASLYYYYRNKEEIFLDVAVREGVQHINDLQTKAVLKKTVEEAVLFYLQERMKYYRHVLNMHKVGAETLSRILPGFFQKYEASLVQEQEFLTQLLKKAMAAGEIRKVDPSEIALLLIRTADALKHYEEQRSVLKKDKAVDYTEATRHLGSMVQLIFAGLKPAHS
jgi:AcrR family transcriptional regulator